MHRLLLCRLSYKVILSCGSDSEESACNLIDLGFTPESGRSPGKGNDSILLWKIPWTVEPGSYSPWSPKKSDTTE